jgi:methyl-accepting chemotaxis protein
MNVSLRALLYLMAAITLAGLVTLGGMALHVADNGARHVAQLNQQALDPLLRLQAIERRIKEIRFRMAGVLLDQLPTVGSANHLKEAQASLPGEWSGFLELAAQQQPPAEQAAQLEKMQKGMPLLQQLLGKLLSCLPAGRHPGDQNPAGRRLARRSQRPDQAHGTVHALLPADGATKAGRHCH